jgi:hypothetical protein
VSKSERRRLPDDWPTFALEFTYNPRDVSLRGEFAPDEVVIFDPTCREDGGDRWISGARDSHVSVDEMR